MTVDQIQEIVDALGFRLHRGIAVDDHTLRLIAVTADHGDSDPARVWSLLHRRTRPEDVDYAHLRTLTAPARVAANAELGLSGRLVVPVRHRDALLGFLWVIDRDETLTASEEAELVATAASIGALLHRRLVVRDRDRALSGHLLETLLDEGPVGRSGAAAELLTHGLIEDDAHVGVLVARCDPASGVDAVETGGAEMGEAVERACRSLAPATWLSSTRHRRSTVLLAHRRPVAERLRATAAAIREAVPGSRIGLCAPAQGLGSAGSAQRQAIVALGVGEALGCPPGILGFEELGPYALIGQLPPDVVTNDLLPLGLFNLLRLGPAQDLLVTLESYLDNAGDKQRTAQQLGVHRSTLYHRLDRIERISGLDLADGGDRLLVHLAVKLHRLARPDVAQEAPDVRHRAG